MTNYRDIIAQAMGDHFKGIISAAWGIPFEETDVFFPKKSFEAYAEVVNTAICEALRKDFNLTSAQGTSDV